MKKSFIKKVSALFTTLLLCFCNSSIQVDGSILSETIHCRTNVKRSNNPMDNGENVNTLDLRNIVLEHYENGSIINTNMQYYEYNGYYQQNDSDDMFFYINHSLNNDISFNVDTFNSSTFTYTIKSFILPISSRLDNYTNSRVYIDFDFTYKVNLFSIGSFNDSIFLYENLSNNLLPSYGYNYFNSYNFDSDRIGYLKGNLNIDINSINSLYVYIVFETPLSFSIPSGTNNLVFSLGKLHIYSETFPHNSVYTNEPDNIYQNGFDIGYEKGLEKGESVGAQNVIDNSYSGKTYQEIYNIGYNTGYSQGHNADNYVSQLFEGIVNIPISVLNGLAPLTFFDLSLIRVIITILAMSVIVWLISYIMSTKG